MTCKDCVHYNVCGFTSITSKSVEKDCRDFKTKADFVEVKHGEWLKGAMPTYGGYKCSVCRENTVHYKAKFCPECGADMRKEGASNESNSVND